MPVSPIPPGYHTATPFLLVPPGAGTVEFLIKGFGAKVVRQCLREDGTIMHAELLIGDSHLMLAECMPPWQPMPCAVYFYVLDTDAVYKAALAAGGTSMMEPADQFYGDRCAGVRDAAGNMWWIGTHIEDVSDEEITRRHDAAVAKQKAVA
jgi:PhnB protein